MARATALLLLLCPVLAGCGGDEARRQALRDRVEDLEILPLDAPEPVSEARVELGRMLFFDPILSGNRDQACATCHSPLHATTDGRSLAVGTAAVVEDGVRLPGPEHTFTPRSAPPLFNLGQPEVEVLFWDGRLVQTEDDRFVLYDVANPGTEVERKVMAAGLERLVSAQVMLPVLDRDEMRGEHGEVDIFGEPNELAIYTDLELEPIWDAVMARLEAEEGYQELFAEAYPETPWEDLEFVDGANAMGDFIVETFTLLDSPWDRFLEGEDEALSDEAVRGGLRFYGEAGCSACHGGRLLTDLDVYNIAVPPMTTGPSDYEDVDLGAAHRSQAGSDDRYAFRAPPLRNVALTGPWMHDGCYASLEAVIHHKDDVLEALWTYDKNQLEPEFQSQVHTSADVLADVELTVSEHVLDPLGLDDPAVQELVAFLEALTSPHALDLEDETPAEVPSGLPMVDP